MKAETTKSLTKMGVIKLAKAVKALITLLYP